MISLYFKRHLTLVTIRFVVATTFLSCTRPPIKYANYQSKANGNCFSIYIPPSFSKVKVDSTTTFYQHTALFHFWTPDSIRSMVVIFNERDLKNGKTMEDVFSEIHDMNDTTPPEPKKRIIKDLVINNRRFKHIIIDLTSMEHPIFIKIIPLQKGIRALKSLY